MLEVALRVAREGVDAVLDELLSLVTDGVFQRDGGEYVELAVRGPAHELPTPEQLERAAAPWLLEVALRELPDDWRARRRLDYEPLVVGERLRIRPDWASSPDPADPMLEVVLGESTAFGAGTHPTTDACLHLLVDLMPIGSFVDLGCGSGVLAIAAAKLGWGPVTAIDADEASVDAASANVRRNMVAVDVLHADLTRELPPHAAAVAANVPAALHATLCRTLSSKARLVIVSGITLGEADAVAADYALHGLRQCQRRERDEWVALLLEAA